MVDTYPLTPAEPSTFIPKDTDELAQHLIEQGNIPEIDVYQCHPDIYGVALDVAERIMRPNIDVRTLIGEYFTAKEVQLETRSSEESVNAQPKQQVTTRVVKSMHKGTPNNYLVTSTLLSDALQLK